MKKFNLLISIMIALALVGCVNDFLDRDIDDNYSEDQVFSSYTTMRNFGIGVYNYLPHGFDRFNGAMLASATDDAVHSGANRTIERLSDGSWGEFNNPDDQWDNLFAGIRKANLFLEKSEDYREIVLRDTVTEGGKQDYLNQTNDLMWLRAETRILRAYFYFELAKRYGGVPLITQPLSPNGDIYRSRDSFDETVDFIVNEIDEARGDLRDTWVGFSGSNWVGRVTDGVALSLKSRTLLYAASPLNNPSGDNQKWIDAAAAAHDVMELNQYSLSDNYKGLFRTIQDDEIILARWYEASNTFERSSYPVGFEGSAGGVNPTQNLVDAYETTNGLSVHEDPAYDPQDPYSNRDPRLQMNIIVNNAAYKGREVEIWDGGSDGPGRSRATRTGYYLQKFAEENLNLSQNTSSGHAWILFRYAEILLNYAEAMNEAYGPDGTTAELTLSARDALGLIRNRTGVNMPAVTAPSADGFREAVRNERRVELAFEEHRFWDVRRWMIGEDLFAAPVYGVKITQNADDSFSFDYPTASSLDQRIFGNHMNLYPIPRTEIDKSGGSLEQNAGWN